MVRLRCVRKLCRRAFWARDNVKSQALYCLACRPLMKAASNRRAKRRQRLASVLSLPAHVGALYCTTCHTRLHDGTDGNGRLVVWCACDGGRERFAPVQRPGTFHRYAATAKRLRELGAGGDRGDGMSASRTDRANRPAPGTSAGRLQERIT